MIINSKSIDILTIEQAQTHVCWVGYFGLQIFQRKCYVIKWPHFLAAMVVVVVIFVYNAIEMRNMSTASIFHASKL